MMNEADDKYLIDYEMRPVRRAYLDGTFGEITDEDAPIIEADALMLGAAPDLLEALERCQSLLAELARPMKQGEDVVGAWRQCLAVEAQARKAIHKAKGATPNV